MQGKEPLIFVTGPRAAGRNAVIENLVQKSLSRQNGGNLLLQYVKLLATDKTVVMSNPMRYFACDVNCFWEKMKVII